MIRNFECIDMEPYDNERKGYPVSACDGTHIEDIAIVRLNGETEYFSPYTEKNTPDEVRRVIENHNNDIIFSSWGAEAILIALTQILRGGTGSADFLRLRHEDGCVDYSIEEHFILGWKRLFVGITDAEGFPHFEAPFGSEVSKDDKTKYARQAAEWLLDDINNLVTDGDWLLESH